MLKQFQKFISTFLIVVLLTVSLSFTSPQPAFAEIFLSAIPETVGRSYFDKLDGTDSSIGHAIEKGVDSSVKSLASGVKNSTSALVSESIKSAASVGANNLAGYAGIARAVSQLGLGPVTTAIAQFMGSSVTGAAATAVVTSAVGGPGVMTIILVNGAWFAINGTYNLAKFGVEKLGSIFDKSQTSELAACPTKP